ncbi:hypothetical protein [Microvirga sp. VF16]|uniref:hypothetical protein n=1 Tax=Microvirga sp. VF16 TaxID=2807101 RepID=UPI00193D9D98|nr:hypothetical protein [Microvirga sp. VF16]QRM31448.1 hypothetical protein JO965_10925 [Microvirga sp. VF16]
MLKDIKRVEKSGASRILLHKDKGKTEDLVRTISTLHLTVTDITLRSTASFDSKVRTHEGADLHGIIGAAEYLRSDGSAPFFDVRSASTGAAATGTATCEDRLYVFQGDNLRRIEGIRLHVQSGTPVRAVVHCLIHDDEPPLAQVDVILAQDQFDTLFRHLWSSPIPAILRVAISPTCFQYAMAGMAPGYPEDVVFPSGVTTAQIDDVAVEKRLSAPAASDMTDGTRAEALADPSLERLDVIRKHADRIATSVKRIEFLAGLAVGILVISAFLR